VVVRCAARMISLVEELRIGCLGLRQTPVAAPPTGASSFVEMTRSLDMVQARLDAVEAHLAGRAPGTPLAEHDEQDLREIQLRVAQLAADLLGGDHPLVNQLVRHEWRLGEVAPAERPPQFLANWARVHRPVAVITDHDPC
jgi:hypothetical protein